MKNKFGIPDFQIKFDEKGFFKRESIKPITREDYKEYDPVDYPAHYNKGAVQCIDAIASMQGDGFKYYLQGSAVKYIWRHEHKGKPVEDLDKAIWFLNKLKEEYK
jgi:hypothetical protein